MMLFSSTAPDRFTCYLLVRKLSIEEIVDNNKRTITFSPILEFIITFTEKFGLPT
jgi:hypothetical protein